jgi:cytochrome c oxidase cbb3-type subunit III
MRVFTAIACSILALTSCSRERRDLRPAPVRLVIYDSAARESPLQPGGPQPESVAANPYAANAYAISEGQRLYDWYNCSGCHSHGGGGIGPPLIKEAQDWIYGSNPQNIFDTIVKGRPNGMPSWGGRIPEYQVWQLVAFVRSLSQLEPRSASPVRTDNLEVKPTIQDKRSGETR